MPILTLGRKAYKEETESLEAPGQFLKHYAPDINSYLIKPAFDSLSNDISKSILLDFNGLNAQMKEKVLIYEDLSATGDFLEAIKQIYDKLRWAETQ